jgi:hypothetical protein
MGRPEAALSPSFSIPAGFTGSTTNYLHSGALTTAKTPYYRIKLLSL